MRGSSLKKMKKRKEMTMDDALKALTRWKGLPAAELEKRLNKAAIRQETEFETRWVMPDGSEVVVDAGSYFYEGAEHYDG